MCSFLILISHHFRSEPQSDVHICTGGAAQRDHLLFPLIFLFFFFFLLLLHRKGKLPKCPHSIFHLAVFFCGRRFQQQTVSPVLTWVAPPAPASGTTQKLPNFTSYLPLLPVSHLPLRRSPAQSRHGAASPAASRRRGVGRHPLHPPPPVEALLPPLQPRLLQRSQRSLPR